MKKTTFTSMLLLALMLVPIGTGAQVRNLRRGEPLPMKKTTPNEMLKEQARTRLEHPLIFKKKRFVPRQSQFVETGHLYKAPKEAVLESTSPLMKAAANTRLLADVIYNVAWTSKNSKPGIYSFSPADIDGIDSVMIGDFGLNAGAAIYDGVIYGVNADFTYASLGYIYETVYIIDTKTGDVSATDVSDRTIIALETAQAPDGTVYGQFFDSEMETLEWGIMDYKKWRRSTIGASEHVYLALGVTSDNRLFGVASDGNLYQINTTTGEETKIGPTGVSDITDSNGNFYGGTGEIDPATNTFYWQIANSTGTASAMYTVNLDDGTATKIADYNPMLQMCGMMVPGAEATDGAPAEASNLKASFANGSLSGTVSFTAPTKSYDGNTLSGMLSYNVSAGNNSLASGLVDPGTQVDAAVSVPADGNYTFCVTTKNTTGTSPQARTFTYVGYDTPLAPAAVTLDMNTSTGLANVSWTAPTKGIHDAYIGQLKYNVYRYADDEKTKVASAISTTSFSETVPTAAMKVYKYGVEAINGSHTGEETLSDGVSMGKAFEVPYYQNFDTQNDFDLFTIIDANNDAETREGVEGAFGTWNYDVLNKYAYYKYSKSNKADDWFISPPINLKAGKTYNIQASGKGSDYYPEILEVFLGASATVAGMTQRVCEATYLNSSSSWQQLKGNNIRVSKDGTYYVGFHALSEPDMERLLLDSIMVVEGTAPSTPDSVTSFTVTPDAGGALSAVLSFVTPTKGMDGKTLTALTQVSVERDGNVVKTFSNPAPGTTLTYTDNTTRGTHTYKVYASNADGEGMPTERKVFIGLDVPLPPVVNTPVDNTTSVDLSWQPSVGENGGNVNQPDITYYLYNVTSSGVSQEAFASVTGNTSYTVSGLTNNQGVQKLTQYAIAAENSAGTSAYNGFDIVTGAPYPVPFKESFSEKHMRTFAYVKNDATAFEIVDDAQDNDGGAVRVLSDDFTGLGIFGLGKITLQGTSHPQFIFQSKAVFREKTTVSLVAQTPDGVVDTLLTFMPGTEWGVQHADLSAYTGVDYVLLRLVFDISTSFDGVTFDDIEVIDAPDNDLAVSLVAPTTAVKGRPFDVTLKVQNRGLKPMKDYEVALNADVAGYTDYTAKAAEVLEPFQTRSFVVSLQNPSITLPSQVKLTASVNGDGDNNSANDLATASLTLTPAEVLPPQNLTLTASDPVTFTWEAPTATEENVVETFDEYSPWETTFGAWTTINNKPANARAGRYFTEHPYPVQGENFAYTVFCPTAIFDSCVAYNPYLAAHSGGQYAAAPFWNDGASTYYDADEYLVSPPLNGKAQTIRFWAHNVNVSSDWEGTTIYAEQFDFLTSQTGNALADFTKQGRTNYVSKGEWQQLSFDVPEGTRYFAIHHNTPAENAFLFYLDDFEFTQGAVMPVSYRIYRNGLYMGTVQAGDALTFTDADWGDLTGAIYSVTAVYADGSESAPVQLTVGDSISSAETTSDADAPAYTISGIKVGTNKPRQRGIYIVGGKKKAVK